MRNHTSAPVREDVDTHLKSAKSTQNSAEPLAPSQDEIRRILRARRARSNFFGPELFADPAWDILLELYAAERGQQKISVSSLCVGSNVPATTALRWIQTLEKRHLLRRISDPMDGRRFFVSLTEKGSRAMIGYFQAVTSRRPF